MPTLRLATVADAASIAAIYAHYVANTVVSFEYEPPTPAEIARRISSTLPRYPYLVCEGKEGVIGYAYSGMHMGRAAYQWNAELSVYIHAEHTGRGLGLALYQSLIGISALQNLRNLYGCVATPNPASERLHLRLGFTPAGVWPKSGYKFGQWHDVTWFEKRLGPANLEPALPLPLTALAPDAVKQILEQAAAKL